MPKKELAMMMTKRVLNVAMGLLLSTAACGVTADGTAGGVADGVIDESLRTTDVPAEEADLTGTANSTFYRVTHPDLRRCVYPLCGGYFTERVNQKTATCSDGTAQPECRILEFDYAALKLDATRTRFLPIVARGDWVVCDRFSDATYAYQGGGRGLDRAKLQQLEHWVHGHLQPDLTLLFDLPLDVARERIALASRVLDRFEQERADFHERVRQAYLDRAHSSPARIRLIDAQQGIDDIRKLLEITVSSTCL